MTHLQSSRATTAMPKYLSESQPPTINVRTKRKLWSILKLSKDQKKLWRCCQTAKSCISDITLPPLFVWPPQLQQNNSFGPIWTKTPCPVIATHSWEWEFDKRPPMHPWACAGFEVMAKLIKLNWVVYATGLDQIKHQCLLAIGCMLGKPQKS